MANTLAISANSVWTSLSGGVLGREDHFNRGRPFCQIRWSDHVPLRHNRNCQ